MFLAFSQTLSPTWKEGAASLHRSAFSCCLFLRITHFGSQVCMKFCHSNNKRSCRLVVSRESLFVKKVHTRIIAEVGKEGRGAGSLGCMIVTHKFRHW